MKQPIFSLKVKLRGVRPAIWRRIEVPADISLFVLHRTLQAAMGWSDSHLHQFIHRGTYYGVPDREFDFPIVSERRTQLSDLFEHPKDRLIYEYDFGDSWEHVVELEDIAVLEPQMRYPRVIGGKRACPPEDVGGYPGYAHFLKTIRDPDHDEHESMLEWVGGRFDSEHFDLKSANNRVPQKRASRRREA